MPSSAPKIYKNDLLTEGTVRELIEKLQAAPPDAVPFVIGLNTGDVEFCYAYDNVEVRLL